MNNNYVAIMAGGIGSRFWPASRTSKPKQFLDIMGTGRSLLQMTYDRFLQLVPKEHIFIVTNQMYADLVKEHLPDLTPNQILCEPSRNNTAPCVAYTAFKLFALNPEANLIIAPSDHVILKEVAFLEQLKKALAFSAQEEVLLTLGITPTRPDTGYGYINYRLDVQPTAGIFKVNAFREKPNRATAETYLAAGDYLWNAGIFIWKAKSILNAFEQYAPEIHQILGEGHSCYNTNEEQTFIDQHYPTTPNISVDYAIMEHADNIYTLPSDIGWSDLGTWASLHAECEKDVLHNLTQGGQCILSETSNTLVRTSKEKLVIVKGLDDYIIVDEEDVLLIFPKSREQEIKQLTQDLEVRFGNRFA